MEESQTLLFFEHKGDAHPVLTVLDEHSIPYVLVDAVMEKGAAVIPVYVEVEPRYFEHATEVVKRHFPDLIQNDGEMKPEVPDFSRGEKKPPEEPQEIDLLLIYLCYVAGALSLPGIFIGLTWARGIKFTEDGREIHKYGPAARKHGSNLVIFGLLAACFWGWLLYKRFGTA